MEWTNIIESIFRWVHILAAIIWAGFSYYFIFVNVPVTTMMDGETKKKVLPDLLPRALYWLRLGSIYTWITGFLLIALIYYHGRLLFEYDYSNRWGFGSVIMIIIVYGAFALYDQMAKSSLNKNNMLFAAVSFVLIALIIFLMKEVGHFNNRAYNIHTGAMFGTIMIANALMRILPAQKKILAAIKNGTAPDLEVVSLTANRSKHNAYLSVPLIWTMISSHIMFASNQSWIVLLAAILIGWLIVYTLYDRAEKVKAS